MRVEISEFENNRELWRYVESNIQGFLDSGEYEIDHFDMILDTPEKSEDIEMTIKLKIGKIQEKVNV